MDRKQIDFSIQEAGCLLYAADRNLAGFPFRKFHEFFGGKNGLTDLTLQGAVMAASLYQDDGYNVRVVIGNLSREEMSEWTSKVSWKLNLESGEMVVSGVCDEDLEEYMEDFPVAENAGDYHLGCFVSVPAGEYSVSIYSYPPNDLAGGWMRLENPADFRMCFGEETDLPFEKPLDFFSRTRPSVNPPAWIEKGYEDAMFLDFVIQLSPLQKDLQTPRFEDDGCLEWEYRKPEICPVGIRI